MIAQITTTHLLLAAAAVWFFWPRGESSSPALPPLSLPSQPPRQSDGEALAAIRRNLAAAEVLTDPVKAAFDTIAAALEAKP